MLLSKGHLVPIVVSVAAGLALVAAGGGAFGWARLYDNAEINSAFQIYWILSAYIAFLLNHYVYLLCGRPKPWWLIAAVVVGMAIVMWPPAPLFTVLYWPFAHLLPGNPHSHAWPLQVIGAYFGPGLGEEFIKALPLFALAWVAVRSNGWWAKTIGLSEPLDGILLGVASATGFAIAETLGVYVINSMGQALTPFVGTFGPEQGVALGAGRAAFTGLVTLLARGLPNLAGHLAYSGLFGYFIGLAVLRPAMAVKLVLLGWATAAALHGTWDAIGFVSDSFATYILLIAVGALSYACLAAAILKARQISPTRATNFATVVRPSGMSPAAASPSRAAAAAPFVPRPAAPPPAPQAAPASAPGIAAATTGNLILTIGPVRRPLTPDTKLEAQMLGSAGAGLGAGTIARVDGTHGAEGLGLVNLSVRPWSVVLPSGRIIEVAGGKAVRLAPGLVIDFGGIKGVVQAA